jgi:hypothetical protein
MKPGPTPERLTSTTSSFGSKHTTESLEERLFMWKNITRNLISYFEQLSSTQARNGEAMRKAARNVAVENFIVKKNGSPDQVFGCGSDMLVTLNLLITSAGLGAEP